MFDQSGKDGPVLYSTADPTSITALGKAYRPEYSASHASSSEAGSQRPAAITPARRRTFEMSSSGFASSDWELIDLPHDWAIDGAWITEGPHGGMGRLPSWGTGWYRKELDIPASHSTKSIFLNVDGAMSYAMVWLNEQLVGGWPFGYSSWRVDLTPYMVPGGENQLVIRLDNPPGSSRWYPGGGIYRNVWLVKTEKVHVGHWGTFVTTRDVSEEAATVDLSVVIDNDGDTNAEVRVDTDVFLLGGQSLDSRVARE